MSGKTKPLAYIALFAALTLVLGYLEATIPVPIAIPGVKLGLANIAVLIALHLMGPRWAFAVMLLKVGVTSLIIGAPSMAVYSLAGSALAYLGMYAAWRFGKLSLVAVSVIAALRCRSDHADARALRQPARHGDRRLHYGYCNGDDRIRSAESASPLAGNR